ncbi:MAG: pyrroline-5-carboxylate reductase [Planctomycetes bacterium]|nr:pyrroline-5-carboxylate reductase [Planctomycetota bacterium]
MRLEDHRIGFVGAGNMAEAMVRGLLASGMPPSGILVSDVRSARLELFSALGVRSLPQNTRLVLESDVLVLSVKPQVMPDILPELRPHVDPSTLVVSIAAGIRTSIIEKNLPPGTPVVRAMPNTPLLVGKGMSVLVKGACADDDHLALALELFSASGRAFSVDDEDLMDAVTAVSGSGPAYVFYLAEAMLKAAVDEGIPPDSAAELVRTTVLGAGALLDASPSSSPSELRSMVTSPGGTTEAAVKLLDETRTFDTLVNAVRRAALRSRELGKGS